MTPSDTPAATNTPTNTLVPSDTPLPVASSNQDEIHAAQTETQESVNRASARIWRLTATARAVDTATAKAVQPSSAEVLNEQGYGLSARYGLRSGIQFKQVGAREIGNAQVLSGGYLDAIDIWGYVEQGYEVCFPQIGRLIILDARTSPRALRDLPYYYRDNMTCAMLDYPGTVVLVPANGGPTPVDAPTGQPAAQQPTAQQFAQPAVSATQLSDCMVTLTHMLNFRDGPNGMIIGQLPYGVTLTAVERTAGWFKVDYYGRKGWISADYTVSQGTCG